MKTNYVKLFGFIISFFAIVSIVNAQGVKVGFVDSEIILKQLPESQKVLTELEGLKKLYIDTIQSKEKNLKESKSKKENSIYKIENINKKLYINKISRLLESGLRQERLHTACLQNGF